MQGMQGMLTFLTEQAKIHGPAENWTKYGGSLLDPKINTLSSKSELEISKLSMANRELLPRAQLAHTSTRTSTM